MNTIYIGHDSREQLAYDVAAGSILRRTDPDKVEIVPLKLSELGHILTRPIERRDGKLWCPISQAPMATEFAISRFCVPFLNKTGGWALFVDSDIVCLSDIRKLFALADDRYAVLCVKHKQESGPDTKMDGQAQLYYSRKNWSSVVLWNCDHPSNQKLTLEALNTWPGRDLHAFKWLKDEEIGELPRAWNTLVGVHDVCIDDDDELVVALKADEHKYRYWKGQDVAGIVKLLHYTLGGQWLPDWKGGPLDEIWIAERKAIG